MRAFFSAPAAPSPARRISTISRSTKRRLVHFVVHEGYLARSPAAAFRRSRLVRFGARRPGASSRRRACFLRPSAASSPSSTQRRRTRVTRGHPHLEHAMQSPRPSTTRLPAPRRTPVEYAHGSACTPPSVPWMTSAFNSICSSGGQANPVFLCRHGGPSLSVANSYGREYTNQSIQQGPGTRSHLQNPNGTSRAKFSDLIFGDVSASDVIRQGICSTSQRPQSSDNEVSLAVYEQTCPVWPCRDRTPARGEGWNEVGFSSTGASTATPPAPPCRTSGGTAPWRDLARGLGERRTRP